MIRSWLVPFLLLPVFACNSGAGKSEPSDALLECAAPNEIDEATLIAWDFEEGVTEMLICGQLSSQLQNALFDSAASLLANPTSAPDAFSFEDGKFRVEQGGAAMTLTVVCGDLSIGCSEGDTIDHDPFDIQSYLAGATSGDFDGPTLWIDYDEPGPLVKLLGLGANPDNPVRLNAAELAVFVNNVQQFRVNTAIEFDQEIESSTITYRVKTGRVDISDTHDGIFSDVEVLDAAATRGDQVMTPVTWDVELGDHALDGVIEMEVTGATPEYLVRYNYGPASSEPYVEMECIETETDATAE